MNTRFPAERVRLSQWSQEIAEKLKHGGPIAISSEAARFLIADLEKAEHRLFEMEAAASVPAVAGTVDKGKAPQFASESSLSRLGDREGTREETRFAWLMERRLTADSTWNRGVAAGTLVYWDGGHAESFTEDPNLAVQWCRQDDALRCTSFTKNYAQWGWQIVEHGFMSRTPSPRPPEATP